MVKKRRTGQDGIFAMIRIRKTTREQLWQRKVNRETLDDVIVRMIKGNDEAKVLESELAELRKKEKDS